VSEHAHRTFPWRITAVVAGVVIAASAIAGVLLSRDRMQSATPDDATVFTPAPQLLPLRRVEVRKLRTLGELRPILLFEVRRGDLFAIHLGGEVGAGEVVIDPEENERNADQGQDHEGKGAGKLFTNVLKHEKSLVALGTWTRDKGGNSIVVG